MVYSRAPADVPRARPSAVLALLAAAACSSTPSSGGDSAIAACQAVSACGGDVAGTWQIDSNCVTIEPPFAQPDCQNVVTRSSFTASGTVTYTPSAADPTSGTEQVNARFAFTIDEVFDDACLKALGLLGASQQACDGLQTYFAGPYAVTCAPSGSTCDCTFADDQAVPQTDTYSVQGSTLMLGSAGPVDFCRSGNTLVESNAGGASPSRLAMHLTGP